MDEHNGAGSAPAESDVNNKEQQNKSMQIQETDADLAKKLLQSPDLKIVEAARRVFGPAFATNKFTNESSAVENNVGDVSNEAAPMQTTQQTPQAQVGAILAAADIISSSPTLNPTAPQPNYLPNSGIPLETQSNEELTARITATTAGSHVNWGAENVSSDVGNEEDKKKPSSTERLQRRTDRAAQPSLSAHPTTTTTPTMTRQYRTSLASRERNRMHARKTRQRKKEHMQNLQDRADELKRKQIQLKQTINEKNTASILLGMFSTSKDGKDPSKSVDPKVEDLLKRSSEDIPDASKIPELPALILPGQHSGKKMKAQASSANATDGDSSKPQHENIINAIPVGGSPNDGIDYDLLGKDRSKCTPAELDKIRRERNRMHAKRTRDRKRIFMEEMEVMIKELEGENELLQKHINTLDANRCAAKSCSAVPVVSPCLGPTSSPSSPPPVDRATPIGGVESETKTCDTGNTAAAQPELENKKNESTPSTDNSQTAAALLLAAAGAFGKQNDSGGMLTISSVATALPETHRQSAHVSLSGEEDNEAYTQSPCKRARLDSGPSPAGMMHSVVPTSITTSGTTAC